MKESLKVISLMALGSMATLAYQRYSVPLMNDMKKMVQEKMDSVM